MHFELKSFFHSTNGQEFFLALKEQLKLVLLILPILKMLHHDKNQTTPKFLADMEHELRLHGDTNGLCLAKCQREPHFANLWS
jgi:hypothetical protein